MDNTGQFFMLGLGGALSLTDSDKEVLESIRPSSVIFFQHNIVDREQVKALVSEISRFLGYKPLVAIDQEGGIVTRLERGFSVSPGAMALARLNDVSAVYRAAEIMACEMRAVGIDWNLAPVVDINSNRENPGIGVRSFGEEREAVVRFAGVFLKAMEDNGIISCLKHFPGIGRVSVDAHIDMPTLNRERELLQNEELFPYRALKAPAWMPSHAYYPALQSRVEPASVSSEVLSSLARDELKFSGALVADDMTMGGVVNSFDVDEACCLSFQAGIDLLPVCHHPEKQLAAYNALKRRIEGGAIPKERVEAARRSVARLFELRSQFEKSVPSVAVDFEKNRAEMAALTFRSLSLLKNRDNLIPVKKVDIVLAMESSRRVAIENQTQSIPWIAGKMAEELNAKLYTLPPERGALNKRLGEAEGKRVLLFTENAHLKELYTEFVSNLAVKSETLLVVALRDPYDSDIPSVENAVCSFGYMETQQQQLYRLLTGDSFESSLRESRIGG